MASNAFADFVEEGKKIAASGRHAGGYDPQGRG
jgi:hypothetical protein